MNGQVIHNAVFKDEQKKNCEGVTSVSVAAGLAL